MKISEIKALGFTDADLERSIYVNPAWVVNFAEFHKKGDGNYREKIIDRLFDLNVDFQSQPNINYELMQRLFIYKCPKCKDITNTKVTEGGGSANSCYITYECLKCDTKCTIGGPDEGMLSYKAPPK